MLALGYYIWYRWFRGDIPHHKTWDEIQSEYETKSK